MKQLVLVLATLCVAVLVGVTWALTRISSWIVHRDHVWHQMDSEGARLEHNVAEVFHLLGGLHIPEVAAALGVTFLVLLWRAFSSPHRTTSLQSFP